MSELRQDPLTGHWVIFAPERARRSSDFLAGHPAVTREDRCPFCPGNEADTPPEILSYRDRGQPDEPGWRLRVVPNKFPALAPEPEADTAAGGLYASAAGAGSHEVIIETPLHGQRLAECSLGQIEEVCRCFRERILAWKRDPRMRAVVIFKNHGPAAGATREHPHSQLMALPVVPKRLAEEIAGVERHFRATGRCVFCDILREEMAGGGRLVFETGEFAAIAPYAARFPFETWLLPKKHGSHFEALGDSALQDLAAALGAALRKIDNALGHPAYNATLMTAPFGDGPLDHYHWRIELLPKLGKVGGFEWATGFYINPTLPEEAARVLRNAASG